MSTTHTPGPCTSCQTKVALDEARGTTTPAGRWATNALATDNHVICRSDARRAIEFPSPAYYDGSAWRWASNGQCMPEDAMVVRGFSVQAILETQAVRAVETAAWLKKYREAQANVQPSEEELYEMRAAFGEGETVVNVLTGRTIKL